MVCCSSRSDKLFWPLLIIFLLIRLALCQVQEKCDNYTISSLKRTTFHVTSNLKYICINGHNDMSIWAIWSDVEISVSTEPGVSVSVVEDESCIKVMSKFRNQSSGWWPMLLSVQLSKWYMSPLNNEGRTAISVPPYGNSCYAVFVDGEQWKGEVIFHKLRFLYPVTMIIGIVLFNRADDIARSILFYYTAGISLGMIMAVFLLLFVISKFIPQRGIGYAFMFCGSSFILYFIQRLKNHIISGDFANMKIFYAYFILAGIISFLYCYYRGPIQTERGLDIMRWSIQSIALCMVYYSIRCKEISMTFVLILIATKWISFQGFFNYVLTRGWMPYCLQAYFCGPRFITMEEYEKQGKEETARALKALREYCESPDCSAWKTVSRLKSPKRFASFMFDGVDVLPEEKAEYDETSFDCAPFLTSDEDSEDELEQGEL